MKPLTEQITPLVHRQMEEEEEEEPIQAKESTGDTPKVAPFFESRINSMKGSGSPMPESLRTFFEPRFGYDFSQVRLYTDTNAAEATKSVSAQAFTYGRDIYFGAGMYSPGTTSGNRLLAHELTHVVQQQSLSWPKQHFASFRGSILQRESSGSTTLASVAGHRYRGCAGDQNFFVDLAQSRSPRWVAMTISNLEDYLSSHQRIVTVIESTLNRFFHPPGGTRGRIGGRHRPETVRRIIHRLRRMMRVLQNPRQFRCVSRNTCRRENSDHDPNALAYAGPSTIISICPDFFTLSPTDQIGTLIHESAHRIGLMRNVTSRDRVIRLPLNRAMNNAESYSLLVTENIIGPPMPAQPAPPAPLTTNWGPAYMSSEVLFSSPVRGLFYEGRGRRRLLSSVQRTFEAPLLTIQPIRFSGQVRFYVDTDETPMPQGTALPVISTQVLFTESGTGSVTELYNHYDVTPNSYLGPGLPLLIPFSPNFNFTLRNNGRLRFTFWMGGANLYASYDDTIYVRPNNDI